MAKSDRPTGVAILAILEGLAGILTLLGGIFVSAFSWSKSFLHALGTLAPFLGAAGIAFVIIGILLLAVAYGLWTGMKWAWWLEIILVALGLIGNLLSLIASPLNAIPSIIVEVIILYYFTRKPVKAYFKM